MEFAASEMRSPPAASDLLRIRSQDSSVARIFLHAGHLSLGVLRLLMVGRRFTEPLHGAFDLALFVALVEHVEDDLLVHRVVERNLEVLLVFPRAARVHLIGFHAVFALGLQREVLDTRPFAPDVTSCEMRLLFSCSSFLSSCDASHALRTGAFSSFFLAFSSTEAAASSDVGMS